MQTVCLYVNAGSRSGRDWFQSAKLELEKSGVTVSEAVMGKVPVLRERVRAAVARKEACIILGGGDGTMSALAPLLAASSSTLGVLPLGTGNALARDLAIPLDLAQACGVIAQGEMREIDLGVIGDQYFLNVATIGLSTQIANQLDPRGKKILGRAAYVAALVRALVIVRPFDAVLNLEGEEHRFRSLQVVIGNGRYHAGPFLLAPDADIGSGYLEVYALATDRKAAFLGLAVRMLKGQQGDLPDVIAKRVKSGSLETTPSRKVTVDGEATLRTPVEFGIRPGALKVFAPVQNGPESAEKGSDGDEGNL